MENEDNNSGYTIEYFFEDGNVFKVYAGDGTTCKYQFISLDEILIDCSPRAIDTWTMRVERDGQFLLFYYSDGEMLKFERMNPRTIVFD